MLMIDWNLVSNLVLTFFIFSFGGWLFEGTISLIRDHELVNRGFFNGPYCPIYGEGAMLFVLLTHWTDRPLELFFFGGLFACVLEYITSWAMEKIYKARWWDYSNWPFNINGRVCLYGFLTFGLFASLIPFMKNGIDQLLALIPQNIQYYVTSGLVAVFAIDAIYTNHVIRKFNNTLRKIQRGFSQHFPLNIINRGKHSKLILKLGNKQLQLLTWQQRRLLNAFPSFKSKYDKAFRAIMTQNRDKLSRFQKNRFKPITQEELSRAKAKAKREGKKYIDERKSNKY